MTTTLTVIDYVAIREAIGRRLDTIPFLRQVSLYEKRDQVEPGNTPLASIWLAATRPPENGTLGGFGHYDYQITWTLRFYTRLDEPGADVEAQRFHEQVTALAFNAFNLEPFLDPGGPGIVDQAFITESRPERSDNDTVWVTACDLTTLITT